MEGMHKQGYFSQEKRKLSENMMNMQNMCDIGEGKQ